MGDGYLLDILLFALVAALLIFRLRSVLGRRDGFQGKREGPLSAPPHASQPRDEASLRLPEERGGDAPANDGVETTYPAAVEAGLTQIQVADPEFNSAEFLNGAAKAFEWILNAFAAGDSQALEQLLSSEVHSNFVQSIRDRQQAGETLESKLVAVKAADIVEAYMAGRTAHMTVKFVTSQITVVRNQHGEIVDGDPELVSEVTDHWTFARDTQSGNPNWMLVATGTPD